MNRWLLVLLSLLFVSGCGPSIPKGVIVKGKITKGGTPVAPAADGTQVPLVTIVSVTTAADGSASGGQAPTDASGEFKVVAGGRGVPPGKYRIQLYQDAGPGSDMFLGAYSGEKYLKEVEVPADKLGSEFDVGTLELNDLKPQTATPAPVASP